MFRRLNIVAALAGLALLAACTPGPAGSQTGVAIEPRALGKSLTAIATAPDSDCHGTGGVKVLPCPIVLTKRTKPGIVVTVSGPGVVNSYLGSLNGCFRHRLCYNAEREGSSQVQWRITSGRSCGGADVEFSGVNASAQEVGVASLKVTNTYCP